MCQKWYEHNLHIGGLIASHWQDNSLVALDCHCNQLLGRPENMDDRGQEMMQLTFKMAIDSG